MMFESRLPRGLAAVFVLVCVVVVAVGAWYFVAERSRQVAMAEEDLTVVAEMKAAQIVQWRNDILADTTVLSQSPLLGGAVADWLGRPHEVDPSPILDRLDVVLQHHHYSNALLVSPDGEVLLQSGTQVQSLHNDARDAVARAVSERQVAIADLHFDVDGSRPHLGIVAPLFSPDDSLTPAALLVLQVDAASLLYPLLQSWPTPSESAECLLVRRDGDDVLFLNDLRHMEGAALTLRVPLTEGDIPAVMAVAGVTGVVEGLDYRGVEVFSVLLPVPDSPWFMVAKVDRSEVFATWRSTSFLIVMLILAMGLATVGVFGFLWQRQERLNISSLAVAHRDLEQSERKHRSLFEQSRDAISINAPDGSAIDANQAWMDMLGYSVDETRSLRAENVYAYPAERHAFLARIAQDGFVADIVKFKKKDGTVFDCQRTVVAQRDADGEIVAFQGIYRDITEQQERERALRESEERFRRAILGAPFPIMIHAEDGQVVIINTPWTRLTGYKHSDIPTIADWTRKAYGTQMDLVRADIDSLFALNGPKAEGEYTITTRSGDSRIWDFSSAPIGQLPDGRRLVISMAMDVTERKHAEEALRESEEFVRTILDNLPLGVAVNSIDPEVAFSYMNDNFLRAYHVERDRISAPDSFWEAVYDDREFRERLRRRVLDDCASGDVERMHWDDVPITREGKEIARISARNVPVSGKPLMLSMVWDVTERNRSARQLARHALRTETLLELHLIGGVEPDRMLDFALDAALRMTESEYGWLGRMDEFESELNIHRWSAAAMQQCALDTGPRVFPVHEGGLWSECVRLRQPVLVNDYAAPAAGKKGIPAGHVPVRRFLAVPVFEGEHIVSMVSVANKSTDYDEFDVDALRFLGNQLWEMLQRRRSEDELRSLNLVLEKRVTERTFQLEASNKELEAFAYSVSHDLRAPLRAIEGFSRILLEDHEAQLDDEGRRLLNVVRSNTARMDQLITDLLELSRVSQSELHSATVDMVSAVESVCADVLPPELRERYELAICDVPEVNGDLTLLKRVWFNLLSNSVKFTSRSESRRIEVGGFGDGGFMTYYVRDTGVGFDQRYVHKLFGVFQRLHSREEFEGTGIGLAIVQRIVHRHGGRVWAEGEPDKGAVFYFSLPKGDGDGNQ